MRIPSYMWFVNLQGGQIYKSTRGPRLRVLSPPDVEVVVEETRTRSPVLNAGRLSFLSRCNNHSSLSLKQEGIY